MTLLAPRDLGLSEIPGEWKVWCLEGCGSTAGLPALTHEKWPHCPEAVLGPFRGREVGTLR